VSRISASDPNVASAEAIIVALAAAGDDSAYAELVRRRQSSVRQLLRRLCRDQALSDDLAQQVFLQAWRRLRTLRSAGAFGAWLRQLTVNVWLQHVRVQRITADSIDDHTPTPAAEQSRLHEQIDLDRALATLPEHVRLCIVLAYSEGLSHGEISNMTALPLGTVKSHISRGAAQLRGLLSGYGNAHDQR
jgi:RNA polymerase sigma factor (sigma-70 family)